MRYGRAKNGTSGMSQTLISLSSIQRDAQAFTDSVLDHLEEQPSFDQVEQIIGQLAELKTLSQWAIGDVLVFVRYRSQFTPKGVWFKNSQDEMPDELIEFVHEQYNCTLSEPEVEVKDLLSWTTHRYERFWLLIRGSEVRLWERNSIEWINDLAFEDYVRQLGGRLRELLDYNSLLTYYHTSAAFPCSQRRPHISWTAHAEVTNIAGQQVPLSVHGLDRLEAKSQIAPRLLEEFEKQEVTTVTELRDAKHEMAQKALGYFWESDVPAYLYVIDADSGKRYQALRFNEKTTTAASPGAQAAKRILTATTGTGGYGSTSHTFPMQLVGDEITMLNGEVIASFVNQEVPVVASALSALTVRLKLIVPY